MKGMSVGILILLGFLAGSGCGSPGESQSGASPSSEAVAERAVIIDVRTPQEYAQGHVTGSTNVPVDVIAERIAHVVPDKSTPVMVHCRSGHRSAAAAKILEREGYQVQDLGSLDNARRVIEGK